MISGARRASTVAVVGPSGAGKSTISRLLFRFYDVTRPDNHRRPGYPRCNAGSLRAAIGIVPQDTVLFNDTIGYNIRYGRSDASDAEVEQAARLAQIDDFIAMLPKGYETDGGRARPQAFGRREAARGDRTHHPESPADPSARRGDFGAGQPHGEEIQNALDRVSRNRTTLVIAHRLSTIIGADEIIVLDQGMIVERGSHQRLLALGGSMPSLWNRQREAEAAREKLALIDDRVVAPNRDPPAVDDIEMTVDDIEITKDAPIERADAAE